MQEDDDDLSACVLSLQVVERWKLQDHMIKGSFDFEDIEASQRRI